MAAPPPLHCRATQWYSALPLPRLHQFSSSDASEPHLGSNNGLDGYHFTQHNCTSTRPGTTVTVWGWVSLKNFIRPSHQVHDITLYIEIQNGHRNPKRGVGLVLFESLGHSSYFHTRVIVEKLNSNKTMKGILPLIDNRGPKSGTIKTNGNRSQFRSSIDRPFSWDFQMLSASGSNGSSSGPAQPLSRTRWRWITADTAVTSLFTGCKCCHFFCSVSVCARVLL